MARQARLFIADEVQWVTLNGLTGVELCKDATDVQELLNIVDDAVEQHQLRWFGWWVLPEQIVLLLSAQAQAQLSKGVQRLSRQYVHYYHRRYGRAGTLWRGRFRNAMVQVEYLPRVLASLARHFSPSVSADVFGLPLEQQTNAGFSVWNCLSQYLSHHLTAEQSNKSDSFLGDEGVIARVEIDSSDAEKSLPFQTIRMELHDAVYNPTVTPSVNRDRLLHCIQSMSLAEAAAWVKKATRGWSVGDAEYLDWVQQQTQQQVAPKPKGGDRRSAQYQSQHGLQNSEVHLSMKCSNGEGQESASDNLQKAPMESVALNTGLLKAPQKNDYVPPKYFEQARTNADTIAQQRRERLVGLLDALSLSDDLVDGLQVNVDALGTAAMPHADSLQSALSTGFAESKQLSTQKSRGEDDEQPKQGQLF